MAMLLRDVLSDVGWQRVHDNLDRAIASAMAYLSELQARRMRGERITETPEDWFSELNELRLGREPDYNMPGLPLAYALR